MSKPPSFPTSGSKMFYTYVLKSERNGMFYIGSTSDINERLRKHNKGYSRYTKNKGSFTLAHKEEYKTLSEAKRREYYLNP